MLPPLGLTAWFMPCSIPIPAGMQTQLTEAEPTQLKARCNGYRGWMNICQTGVQEQCRCQERDFDEVGRRVGLWMEALGAGR